MAHEDEDWKDWPPDGDTLIQEIEKAWKDAPGSGPHWIVKVDGTNPLSGYCVIKKPVGGGH
jgi:hypothetical protein